MSDVCISMYIYLNSLIIHTHTHIHIHLYIYIYTCISTYMFIYKQTLTLAFAPTEAREGKDGGRLQALLDICEIHI